MNRRAPAAPSSRTRTLQPVARISAAVISVVFTRVAILVANPPGSGAHGELLGEPARTRQEAVVRRQEYRGPGVLGARKVQRVKGVKPAGRQILRPRLNGVVNVDPVRCAGEQ